MGYRSDVVAIFYAIDKTGEEHKEFNERNRAKLKLFMDENFPKILQEKNDMNDGLTMLDTGRRLVFEFMATNVKWYDSYPEVMAFEAFWDRFKELIEENADAEMDINQEPCEWSCEFIRLGENTDDIEERSSDDAEWLLSVSREIQTDY